MERKKDGKNFLIGGLVVIMLIMAVGFAVSSQELPINATGTVSDNFSVKFEEGTITESYISTGVTSSLIVSSDKLSATLDSTFTTPGDYVLYTIKILNTGNLDAYLKTISLVSAATVPGSNDANIKISYSLKNTVDGSVYTSGSKRGEEASTIDTSFTPDSSVSTISKYTGINYLTIKFEYVADTQSPANATAKYTLSLNYEQVS